MDEKATFRDMLDALGLSHYSPDAFGKALNRFTTRNNSSIKTLSLFSGAGGLDIGFKDAGFDIVEQNELVDDFAETLRINDSDNCKVVCKDVREYSGKSLKGKIDFIIGGPPCQPFSSASRRAFGVNGTIDARGTLFNEYVRILSEIQPKGFLFENVYGIVSANKGQDWNMIITAFKRAGYNIHYKILDAADYGAPQHRARLIIVGLKENLNYKFPLPNHGPDSPDKLKYFSAQEALEDVPNSAETNLKVTGKYGYLLDNIPVGMNYSYYTSKIGNPNAIFAWRSKFSDFLYKADPTQPVKTIKASGGQYTGPFHWKNRRFTVAEYKRLQTFPDNYKINGSRMIQIKQIGNSVPPQFARFLALSIRAEVFKAEMPFKLNYMDENYKLSFNSYKRKLSRRYYKKAEEHLSKNKEDVKSPLKSHQNYSNLNSNMSFEISDKASANFKYDFKLNDNEILLKLNDNKTESKKAIVNLKVELSEPLYGIFNRIILKSYSTNFYGYTAMWKALEYELSSHKVKGDLVQLSGYYQYSPKIRITGTWDKAFPVSLSLMNHIISNDITSQLLTLNEMSKRVDVKPDKLKMDLQVLKDMGYEVRNENTNVQIPQGYWMIPYAFPTLSNLSVQMYKRL
ncbi:DNA cytosine methyltransferase [Lactobacillus crispatus]|uniref:DNA cytosine methyltransferase n=1 Tax=Lactobacillus crispatus TaxID=47770 RepID=UPI0025A45D05|nr:DNA cytosine methyltransferase [Lactobacillus crispatus]MDM8291140.1 DNA cytosine methyltransferase [Lactobacillus crispatus]